MIVRISGEDQYRLADDQTAGHVDVPKLAADAEPPGVARRGASAGAVGRLT